MLKQGDKVQYIPSGRIVEVHHDQNSGQRIAIIDHSQDPSPIINVPPSDLRRITEEVREA